MILIMHNDFVILYDMTEEEFESLDELNNLENYEIFRILKNDFTSGWLKDSLGESSKLIRSYYYDSGSKLVKKEINDISEISYYVDESGRLWPSLEYYKMTKKRADIDPILEKLIERDYKLNQLIHISELLTLEQREEFNRYYDKLFINSNKDIKGANMVGKAYEVPCFCKLILKDEVEKLSSGKLNGCVFLIAIPAGIDSNNETKFFFHPYEITKTDTKALTKIYRQILNENGLKADDLTPEERVPYFEMTVKKYLKEEIYNLVSSIQIGGTSYTWEEYRKIFRNEYGFALDNLLLNWDIFEKKLIDARLVEDEKIVPLVVEYSRQLTSTKVIEPEVKLTHVSPVTLDLLGEENVVEEVIPEETQVALVEEEVVPEEPEVISSSELTEEDTTYYDAENNRTWITKEAYEQHKQTGEQYYMVGGVCRLLSSISKKETVIDLPVMEEEIVNDRLTDEVTPVVDYSVQDEVSPTLVTESQDVFDVQVVSPIIESSEKEKVSEEVTTPVDAEENLGIFDSPENVFDVPMVSSVQEEKTPVIVSNPEDVFDVPVVSPIIESSEKEKVSEEVTSDTVDAEENLGIFDSPENVFDVPMVSLVQEEKTPVIVSNPEDVFDVPMVSPFVSPINWGEIVTEPTEATEQDDLTAYISELPQNPTYFTPSDFEIDVPINDKGPKKV